MWRCFAVLSVLMLIGGCQSTHEELLAKGYPPAFADGFDDGCSSGRQAAGAINGTFRKNVLRYLDDARYAEGWSDGFRQCHALQNSEEQRQYRDRYWDQRDRDWEQEKDRGAARAYRHP